MNSQEQKNFETKNIEVLTKFQISRSFSPKRNCKQIKLSPLLIPKGQNDQLSDLCIISDINFIQKPQDTLQQYCNKNRFNHDKKLKKSNELGLLNQLELSQSQNFLRFSNRDFEQNTSTLSQNLCQIKTVNTKFFKRNLKCFNNPEQETDQRKDSQNNFGDDQDQVKIALDIKKCVSIYESQKIKSIEKSDCIIEFVKNLLQILNLLILAEQKNVKKQFERIKEDIFSEIKSLIFCADKYIYQVINCSIQECKQLSYQDICNQLVKKLQNIDNNSFYQLQQSQLLPEDAPSCFQNAEKQPFQRSSLLDNNEINKLKQEIQVYQNQKKQFINELDSLQEKFKLQSDQINILQLQMQKNKKQVEEKSQIEKMELNQRILSLQNDLKKQETQNDDLKRKQKQLCIFASNLLINIANQNKKIDDYETNYIKKEFQSQTSQQTRQFMPQIPQNIQYLLDNQDK